MACRARAARGRDRGDGGRGELLREWQRTLHSGRWVGIHWPVEYGGRAASLAQVAIYNEELARAGAPPILGRVGVTLVGPTLMAHGTEAQRARVDAEDPRAPTTCGASCSASRARAVTSPAFRRERSKSGGVYRVTGPEGLVVIRDVRRPGYRARCARTRTPLRTRESPCSAIPMDAKGVEVRPLRQMTGEHEFNEVVSRRRRGPGRATSSARRTRVGGSRTRRSRNERGASFIWREQVLHEVAIDALVQGVRASGMRRGSGRASATRASRGSTSRSFVCTTRAHSLDSRAARRSARSRAS